MDIILVPSSARKGKIATLNHRHLWFAGFVLLILVPTLIGYLTFRTQVILAKDGGELASVAAQEKALSAQKASLEKAKKDTQNHLNALALKMGQLQAQVLRLNALGARLTRMAGLDNREFNFAQEPAMGGPEKRANTAALTASSSNDVLASLERLTFEIDRQRERLVALESLLLDRKLSAQVTPSGWPVDGGWVSSGFGHRADPFTGHQSYHEGVDIASKFGSPVYVMGDGVIEYVGEKSGYGFVVEVTHESGLITRYAHISSSPVKVGDKVIKGQAIAKVGTSGRSTGPHLHFEVVKNGGAVNPKHYLSSPDDKDIELLVTKSILPKANVQ
jgi:murein DD-endopeptidase MepM/ murein hydrolase activator NlpD